MLSEPFPSFLPSRLLQRPYVGAAGRGPEEVTKAQQAAAEAELQRPGPTVFSRILEGSLPAHVLYEDDQVLLLLLPLPGVGGIPLRSAPGF